MARLPLAGGRRKRQITDVAFATTSTTSDGAKKVALVTGAARGVGRYIARALGADHAVAITWLSTQPCQSDADLCVQADLTKPGQCAALVDQIIDRFGRLDVIVNNAGVVHATEKAEFDAVTAQHMFAVNAQAPGILLSHALPQLRPGAAIVNVSSVNAMMPPAGASIYAASKAALNAWTLAMAKELGPLGIRVNAVAPGAVNIPEEPRSAEVVDMFTRDTALGRIVDPQDVAAAVQFLASDQARAITGQILTVDGGYRL